MQDKYQSLFFKSLFLSFSFSLSLFPHFHCGLLSSIARDTIAIFGAIANIERKLQLHCTTIKLYSSFAR